MAIDTITLTKESVNLQLPNLYTISIRLVCKDSSVEVINDLVSERYRPGDDISTIAAKIQKKMQAIIDQYVAEQVIFNQAVLDTQITNIESNLRDDNI